jgi:hypothetical protein
VWMVAPAVRIKQAGAKATVSNSQGAVKAAMDQPTADHCLWPCVAEQVHSLQRRESQALQAQARHSAAPAM